MPSNSVGSIALDLTLNPRAFDRAQQQTIQKAQQLGTNLNGIFKKAGAVIASALAVKELVNFGKSCIDLGSDLAEVQNVVDVTFGAMSNDINSFAKQAITQFGLSATKAKQYSSTMGAMLKSMGLSTEQALDMSKAITGLSADMASFYNLDNETAFQKIRSGISGETEPLKQLGINMSVANLEAYALSKGLTKSFNKMSQMEQATLRYNYLLSVTSDAQGDFARTSSGWANQVRILQENWNSLKATLGQVLINVITPLLNGLNNVIQALAVGAEKAKGFLNALMGKQDEIVESTASSMTMIADSTQESADGMQDTTKEAKKLKNVLAGFDNLNILNFGDDEQDANSIANALSTPKTIGTTPTTATTGMGSQSFEWLVNIKVVGAELLQNAKNKLNELKNSFMKGLKLSLDAGEFPTVTQGILDNIQRIKDALMGIFLDPQLQTDINNLVNAWATAAGSIIGSIASIGASIADWITGGIAKYFEQNSDFIQKFLDIIVLAETKWAELTVRWYALGAEFAKVFRTEEAKQALSELIALFANVALGFTAMLTKIGADINETILKPLEQNAEGIKKVFTDIFGTIAARLHPINEAIKQLFEAFNTAYDENVKPALDGISQGLSSFIDTLVDVWNEYIKPYADYLTSWFNDEIKTNVEPILEDIIIRVTDIFNGLASIFALDGGGLGAVLGGILNVLGYISGITQQVLMKVFEGLLVLIDMVCAAVQAFIGWLKNVAETAYEVGQGTKNAGDLIYAVFKPLIALFQTIGKTLSSALSNAWTAIKKTFSGVGKFFGDAFNGAVMNIKKAFSGVKKWFSDLFDGIKTTFSNVGTTVGNAVGDAFKKVINTVLTTVENTLNVFIDAINGAVDAINAIPGVSIDKLTRFNFTKLAKGGVITQPTLAMVGEQGKEAVMPLENNTGWIDSLAMKIATAVNGGGNINTSSRPIEIQLNINGTKFGRVCADSINALQRKVGKTVLEV